jgi:N-acetylglucosamine kinase-like BadF-type ATPase
MSFFVAGIDGGQSSTTAVVGDANGRVVGRGSAGPADEIGAGARSTRLHDALANALEAAGSQAGLPADVRFEAIVAGISGYEGRVYGKPPELPSQRLVLMHDAPIAHAGAFAGRAGVVALAGTGSVIYSAGVRERTRGGWGYLFGDEGSAFWLAREALALLMRREDEDRPAAAAARAACEFFALPTMRGIARAFYMGELTRERVAAFAPVALGFAATRPIVTRGAERLAALVVAAVRAGAPPEVAFAGGTFANARFRAGLEAALRRKLPAVRIVEPAYDPATGALLLAYRAAGRDAGELTAAAQ